MTRPEYNPFNRQYYKETQHGIIGKIERRYFTHRRPEHIFKKYQAFGISTTEMEICWNEHVNNIIIKYHGKDKNTYYKIKLEMLKYMKRFDNKGDEQIIIPIKEMEIVGEEEIYNEWITNKT